jgi:hypothetical protein
VIGVVCVEASIADGVFFKWIVSGDEVNHKQ